MKCFPGGCLTRACQAELKGSKAAGRKHSDTKSADQQIIVKAADGEAGDDVTAIRDQALGRRAVQELHHTQPQATGVTDLYCYILQHGRGILSLSTLQEGLQHFVMPGVGYIAYTMMRNGPDFLNILTPIALGDPICHPGHFAMMAGEFLRQHPKAMFMQVSGEFAAVLQSLGMLINSVGGDTVLNLATYTFSGYAKRGLRSAIASAVKEGVTVNEVMQAPVTATDINSGYTAHADKHLNKLVKEMQEVDREWLARKGKRAARFWFINRQPVFAPEPGVRKFTARDSTGRLLGYIFFDAVYEAGSVVGYYANVTRMRPDAHPGVLNLLIKEFIDRVRAESHLQTPASKVSMKKSLKQKLQHSPNAPTSESFNSFNQQKQASNGTSSSTSSSAVQFLSLGLSPLHQMDDSRFTHSASVRRHFEFSYDSGSGFYPFKPLAAAKAKYGAGLHQGKHDDPSVTYQQVYLAHTHDSFVVSMIAMIDMGKTIGLWKHPADALSALLKHKVTAAIQERKDRKSKSKAAMSSNKDAAISSSNNNMQARSVADKKQAVGDVRSSHGAPATATTTAAGVSVPSVQADTSAAATATLSSEPSASFLISTAYSGSTAGIECTLHSKQSSMSGQSSCGSNLGHAAAQLHASSRSSSMSTAVMSCGS